MGMLDMTVGIMTKEECEKTLKEQEDAWKHYINIEIAKNIKKDEKMKNMVTKQECNERVTKQYERFKKMWKEKGQEILEKANAQHKRILKEQLAKLRASDNAQHRRILAEVRAQDRKEWMDYAAKVKETQSRLVEINRGLQADLKKKTEERDAARTELNMLKAAQTLGGMGSNKRPRTNLRFN